MCQSIYLHVLFTSIQCKIPITLTDSFVFQAYNHDITTDTLMWKQLQINTRKRYYHMLKTWWFRKIQRLNCTTWPNLNNTHVLRSLEVAESWSDCVQGPENKRLRVTSFLKGGHPLNNSASLYFFRWFSLISTESRWFSLNSTENRWFLSAYFWVFLMPPSFRPVWADLRYQLTKVSWRPGNKRW